MSLSNHLFLDPEYTQYNELVGQVTELENGLVPKTRWLMRPATQRVGRRVADYKIIMLGMSENSDCMGVGYFLPESHAHHNHLLHVGLGSPEMLVEESFEALDHGAGLTRKLRHLL